MDFCRRGVLGLILATGVLAGAQVQPAPHAQPPPIAGIAGSWQGTLHTPDGQDLRIVIRIAQDAKGALTGTLFSLDENGRPMTADSVTDVGGTLRFVNQFSGFTFEGRMAADGRSISGTVRQNGVYPLLLERATPETAWSIPEAPRQAPPMAPGAQPGIEVATIKPTRPNPRRSGMTFRGREVVVEAYSLDDLVKFAYDLQEQQLLNVPPWMRTEKFDIGILPDQPGFPSPRQFQILIKKLLADRFGLRFHQETKNLSVYVLHVGKDGPKLTQSADPSDPGGMSIGPLGLIHAHNISMGRFAAKMQAMVLDRPVLDRTGLAGRWNFVLRWQVDDSQFGGQLHAPPPDPADPLPPLFTAMQEQLGLRLEAQKTAVPVLVIDRIEPPTPN